jgi:transcriptional regulator with GAF, ATPase, and Fis domain
MRALLERTAPIAASDASVIILGESGTGKEIFARAIHANSNRSGGRFVAVNVAALPSELLESELFGHVRGAFTGASTLKRGLFEEADGGTLLLDEVAEMPLGLQAKLLRALQDGEVRRVGDTRAFSVDVRVLCATHQDLQARIAERLFREDLYYRLRVFTLNIPPLRERADDILPLARLFLSREGHATGCFTPAAERALAAHRWPGNVRELGNAMSSAPTCCACWRHAAGDTRRPRESSASAARRCGDYSRISGSTARSRRSARRARRRRRHKRRQRFERLRSHA